MTSTTSMEGRDCSTLEFDVQRIGVPKIDGELLMEFLEDTYDEDVTEDERLGYLMRSFEEEIGEGGTATALLEVGDGESTTGPIDEGGDYGLMEDLLTDLDSEDISRPPFSVEDPFEWVDIDMAACSAANMGACWYSDVEMLGDNQVVGCEKGKDYLSMYYGQFNMEQVYSPLWQ